MPRLEPTSNRIERESEAHAARLITRVGATQLVLLTAPTGFGKTHVASQIADETGHPVAWCSIRQHSTVSSLWVDVCCAMLEAWPDAPSETTDVTEENAAGLLARCLDVIGATTLVLDDVDHLVDDALDLVLERIASVRSLRILMTSRLGPTPMLAVLEASGRMTRIGASDLEFSAEQCVDMVGDDAAGGDLHAATAGWPIAVLVGARAVHRQDDRTPDDSLLQLFLRSHPEFVRSRLAVAALLESVPPSLVEWLSAPGGRTVDPNAAILLLQPAGDGQSIRRWAREGLHNDDLDPTAIDEALDLLHRAGDDGARFALAIAAGRVEIVLTDIERYCANQVASGGHHRVRRVIDRIAPEHRSVDIKISAILAEQATNSRRPHEDELRELVRAARREGGQPSPRANSALANHLRMVGDPAVIEVCHEVVAPLVELSPEEASATARSLWPDLPDRIAAGELLRFLGQGAMLSAGPGMFASGRQMVRSAMRILEDEQSVRSQQGWLLYIEALMLVEEPSKVVLRVRTIAIELWRARHSDAPLRLSELAILEFFLGWYDRSRSTIELAREASAETGNDLAALPLIALECALDVIDAPGSPEPIEAFEHAIFELLDHDYLAVFHQVFAAEFGLLQIHLGNTAVASHFAAVADQSPNNFMSASFSLRRRRLNALLLNEHDRARGRADLVELRSLAVELDRPALASQIDGDLADVFVTEESDGDTTETLHIVALAPAFSIWRGGFELPAPSGYTAKLLALLIASSGIVTIDVALEALWPNADPRVSRNRLHGVLLRLRRALGFGPDGPVTCRDELIRLEAGPTLSCDVWDLEAAIDSEEDIVNIGDVADVLFEQFRYDDRVSIYRDDLRRRINRARSAADFETTTN